MLKITSHRTPDSVRLTLEGRLSGPWVNELEQVWRNTGQSGTGPFVVDVTEVTFIVEDGKALLSRMWREGAALVANGCCTGHVVDEITGSRSNASSDGSGTTQGRNIIRTLAFLIWSFFVAACAVGPDYSRPDLSTPDKFRMAGAEQEAAEAQARETIAQYEQTILVACREVEDDLVAVKTAREQRVAQAGQVDALRSALQLASLRSI